MKSSKKMFVLTEAVLAVLVVMTAIAMLRGKSGEKHSKISVIIQDSDDNQWAAFKFGLRMAAQDQNVEMFVVSTGEALSAEEEYEAVEDEIENGADAVILQPVPGKDMEELLERIEKKIPVTLVAPPASEDHTVSRIPAVYPDNYAMGKALAEELLRDYGGKIKGKTVGIVSRQGDSTAVLEREKGLCSILEDNGAEVSWTVSDFSTEEEEYILEIKAKADFVIALDDDSLVLAGKTASANNLHGALVYGIGNSMEAVYCLDTGFVRCLVVPDDFTMGYQSLTETAEGLGHIFRRPQSRTVSFTVMRRDTLFLKENQEILFTMSQ